MAKIKRLEINVRGRVQGVGFRPFVHRLAIERSLKGFVRNEGEGVKIVIEGSESSIESFLFSLENELPRLAEITSKTMHELVPLKDNAEKSFTIEHSLEGKHLALAIPQDVAICENCLRELFEPDDRRYRYPFINCTDCGPRYTIITDMPYDRPNTTMREFKMCDKCQAEYDDPASRRFHAQPNACPVCGPQLVLLDSKGNIVAKQDKALELTVTALKEGKIVAIKSLGGFQLACDALSETTVSELRKRKKRPEKPFAIMVPSLNAAKDFAKSDKTAASLLASHNAPIVLLEAKTNSQLALSVGKGFPDVGIMLPYTPLHFLIFFTDILSKPQFNALVMTSGNISEEPIAIDNREAVLRLGGIADLILTHNRDILTRCDDSLVGYSPRNHTASGAVPARIARGIAPLRVSLNRKSKKHIIALGAGLKNTVCAIRDDEAFISQHTGDLDDERNAEFLSEVISHLSNLLGIRPEIAVCDKHPDFFSTRYAERLAEEVVKVQHHFAHSAAVAAELKIEKPMLSIVLDGTGLGDDGAIWGGELLVSEPRSFTRFGALEYLPLAGGDTAIKKPWRIGLSYLNSLNLPSTPFEKRMEMFYSKEVEVLREQLQAHINSPLTSSAGRFFDAVSAILGICDIATFEAEAAMKLEAAALQIYQNHPDNLSAKINLIKDETGITRIQLKPFFSFITNESKGNLSQEKRAQLALMAHLFIARAFAELAVLAREETKISEISLSGGAMVNRILQAELFSILKEKKFTVYLPNLVPPNDAAISLGQAYHALACEY